MVNPELIAYIKGELARGTALPTIRGLLLANGWRDEDVDEAVQTIRPDRSAVVDIPPTVRPVVAETESVRQPPTESTVQPATKIEAATPALSDTEENPRENISPLQTETAIAAAEMKPEMEESMLPPLSGKPTRPVVAEGPAPRGVFFPKQAASVPRRRALIITAVALIVIALLAGLAYWFVISKKSVSAPSAASPASASVAPKPAATLGVTDTYRQIHAALMNVKTFDDLAVFITAYGTARQIAQTKATADRLKTLSQSARDNFVKTLFADVPQVSDITAIAESDRGLAATLAITTKKSNVTGLAVLVRENGVWKLDSETWNVK